MILSSTIRMLITQQLTFPFAPSSAQRVQQPVRAPQELVQELAQFAAFGTSTRADRVHLPGKKNQEIPSFINEFWTARQRAANALHEISYRACFKPQLPRFFIERLTQPGQSVYDPFMGRGTTLVEAALLGRRPAGCDVNPLSVLLTQPRLQPPLLSEINERLSVIPWRFTGKVPEELLVFYHPETLREICALRAYFLKRQKSGEADAVDHWIAMVAVNRLTGHSPGFFSVYTLPPNQAVSVRSQQRINDRRGQTPPRRSVEKLILKKSRQLLKDCDEPTRQLLATVASKATCLTGPAHATPQLADDSIDLVVTSPPFLNVVQYSIDNWLRCWFLGVNAAKVRLTICSNLPKWQRAMTKIFKELRRVLKPGGYVAFEVGEVEGGSIALEEGALPCGLAAGLEPVLLVINQQQFTKTSQCWGVDNNHKGTNSNRILLFRKP